MTNPSGRSILVIAGGLSLGAAISLGLSRFSYALLLPAMREDLGWSYFLAGGMNTANALGYLSGALLCPLVIRHANVHRTLLIGALLTVVFMLTCGLTTDATVLLSQRYLAGLASALTFVSGGLLAARLGALTENKMGLVLGIYYGGAGLGIVVSSLLVPLVPQLLATGARAHEWQAIWIALSVACLLATLALGIAAYRIPAPAFRTQNAGAFNVTDFAWGLGGYLCFGIGYIGYMTFIIALLKQHGMSATAITSFYILLGAGVVFSSFIWARMLDRFRGGESLAILNALLALATVIPVLSASPPVTFLSGILFGSVFLSVVASTTALVRHNLPATEWSRGISAFTIVFALGQIIGPLLTGALSDGEAGLSKGFMFSAVILFAGALAAWRQRPLKT